MPFVTADKSLPRSLDVQIALARAQAETRTQMDILCVACEDLGHLHDASRIRFYSTIEAVETDFADGTEAHLAASAFFAQTPRPSQMAIGEVFMEDQAAKLVSAPLTAANITAIELITTGSIKLTYDVGAGDVELSLTALDFDTVTTIEAIAAIIDTALGENPLECIVKTLPGGTKVLVIQTTTAGSTKTISYPAEALSGAYVGTALNLTAAKAGRVINGYTFVSIADELSSLANAANAVDKFIYGWCLGATLRDVAIMTTAAAWALTRTAIMGLTTNDLTALSSGYSADIGSVVLATGNRRVFLNYHDNIQKYPDVSILAYMLHVNYRLADSTVTGKFKVLSGVTTVALTETELAALQAKGYNVYTAIGNDARTYREGETAEAGWFMDTVINLDNFVEDLSVNTYNVFLRNKKVPFTRPGQMLMVDACRDTGNQYTYNGTFADREVADTTRKSGSSIVPAVQITPTPISQSTAANRAARSGPPIQMVVQEAGAIHSIAINVEAVS